MTEKKTIKEKIFEVIFESDTYYGKLFDIILLIAILLSVLTVIIESVESIKLAIGNVLYNVEWIFTILFTIEYFFRIYSSHKTAKYIFSFWGIIDLLAILPTYISILIPGAQFLIVIRFVRILRVFTVLKMTRYMYASTYLFLSLKSSWYRIFVFFAFILILVTLLGSIVYVIEGPQNGFSDIPTSIYWAIVTLTTVGYGDIIPLTAIGKAIASIIMILGYSIIAVPTGIVSVEMHRLRLNYAKHVCPNCKKIGHEEESTYCKYCGTFLNK